MSADPKEGTEGPPTNSADLTVFVQNLLEQMQGRFNLMSEAIIGRIDEMGGRIDDLEKSIGELMEQVRNKKVFFLIFFGWGCK